MSIRRITSLFCAFAAISACTTPVESGGDVAQADGALDPADIRVAVDKTSARWTLVLDVSGCGVRRDLDCSHEQTDLAERLRAQEYSSGQAYGNDPASWENTVWTRLYAPTSTMVWEQTTLRSITINLMVEIDADESHEESKPYWEEAILHELKANGVRYVLTMTREWIAESLGLPLANVCDPGVESRR